MFVWKQPSLSSRNRGTQGKTRATLESLTDSTFRCKMPIGEGALIVQRRDDVS
jgi:hypothetical protein